MDGIHVLNILFDGVGIIKTEVADTMVTLGNTKVHTDGFDVSDMQVAVGFGRETGLNTSAVLALGKVFLYDLLNEIETSFFCFHTLLN